MYTVMKTFSLHLEDKKTKYIDFPRANCLENQYTTLGTLGPWKCQKLNFVSPPKSKLLKWNTIYSQTLE